jgi:hypothetical protein
VNRVKVQTHFRRSLPAPECEECELVAQLQCLFASCRCSFVICNRLWSHVKLKGKRTLHSRLRSLPRLRQTRFPLFCFYCCCACFAFSSRSLPGANCCRCQAAAPRHFFSSPLIICLEQLKRLKRLQIAFCARYR